MIREWTRRAALIAQCACAAACAGGAEGSPEGASLRVGQPAPVIKANDVGITFHKFALTRETLVTIGGDGRPGPRILESWEAAPDRLTWRLKIRSGVRFHDGTPVTAGALAPHVSSRLRTLSSGAVRDVTAAGDEMLVVALNEPYAFLFEDIATISAEHAVGSQRFGTGPYVLTEESPERLVFASVDNHYRGTPAIDRVEVRLYPEQRNAWSALMRDEIDMLYDVSRESLEFVRGESSVAVSTFTRPFVYLLGLNHGHPQLRDPRVRRALSDGVDRNALVRVALAGEGEPAGGYIWPNHWAYDPAASSATYDPQNAVRLLENAGLQVRHERGRMPARLRIRCAVYESMRKIGLVLQRQLAAIDVDLQLEVVDLPQMIERLTTGNYDSFVFEMASLRGFKSPYQFWRSDTVMLKHGYAGADDVLDRVRRAASDEEFRLAASALQQRFRDDPPAVFLAWDRTSRAVTRRFEVPSTTEDVYHSIARWKPAAKDSN